MDQWFFMKDFVDLQKQVKAKGGKVKNSDKKDNSKIKPDFTFIKDVVTDYYLVSTKKTYNLLPFRKDLLNRKVIKLSGNWLYIQESYQYFGR